MAFVIDKTGIPWRTYDKDRGIEIGISGGGADGHKEYSLGRYHERSDVGNVDRLGSIRLETNLFGLVDGQGRSVVKGADGYWPVIVSAGSGDPSFPLKGYSEKESAEIIYDALRVLENYGKTKVEGAKKRIRFHPNIEKFLGGFDYD